MEKLLNEILTTVRAKNENRIESYVKENHIDLFFYLFYLSIYLKLTMIKEVLYTKIHIK